MPERPDCVIAGCGPAGAMLALLLARAGANVVVLEKHPDFLRDFRGDTIHPSTLQVIDELGLIDRFLALPHRKTSRLSAITDQGTFPLVDFRFTRARYPYIAFMPQWDFLDFVVDRAQELDGFELRRQAEAVELVRDAGRVAGVRYRAADGSEHEVRAPLTVATDGRHSDVRRAAGMTPRDLGAPMDVLWFRLSRRDDDPGNAFGRITAGRFMAFIDRGTHWQIGYVIPKDSQDALHAQGLGAFRESLTRLAPFLGDRAAEVTSWDDLKLLTVTVNRLERWHQPGLLCIGDAAHAMSPIGGVGINLAIQDAVAAANLLHRPLRERRVTEADLAAVQKRRTLPTVATQKIQTTLQKRLISPVLAGTTQVRAPLALRLMRGLPVLQGIPARLLGFGVRPEHVAPDLRAT
jgi:2-polyprenyl-6-methoxyphenol hydroxylase-like FAD-dependent oxidoreductase